MSDDDQAFPSIPSPPSPGQGRAEDGDLMDNGERLLSQESQNLIIQISLVLTHLVLVMVQRREMETCPNWPRSQPQRGQE